MGGMYGPATAEAVAAAGGSATGVSGATIGSLGAGALGIAGGLYGAYSGFERGGIGGAVQGTAGLATAGMSAYAMAMGTMSAIPVYGWIAAAVLAIVGALLPGQKPSGKGQEFRMDLGSGETYKNGLTGERYSAENASMAEAATMSIANLASEISNKLGGAQIGGGIAVGVTSSRGNGPGTLYLEVSGRKAQFSNDEEGSKQLAEKAGEYMLELFKEYNGLTGQDSDYQRILHSSGSLDALSQNVEWYETVYKSFQDGAKAADQFHQQMEAVNDSFSAVYWRARDLSLATDKISEAWEKEQQRLIDARDLQVKGYDIGLSIRSARAGGSNDATLMQQAALLQFDYEAAQQIAQARASLESLGLTSEEVSQRIVRNERVLAEERLAVIEQFADQARARDEQIAGIDTNMAIRLRQAAGQTQEAALMRFDYQAKREIEQARAVLESFGIAAQDVAARIVTNERVLAEERLAIQRTYTEQAAGSALNVVTSMRDYVRGLSTSDASAGTVMDRYGAAAQDFNAIFGAAQAGDAKSISGLRDAAETYRALAREVYGGGQGYADALQLIGERLGSVADLGAEALTQSFVRENDRQNFERLSDTLNGGFGSLRAELNDMRRDLNMILTRPGGLSNAA